VLPARDWNSLYQQNPIPDDGDYFKSAWFGEYEQLPDNLRIYAASDYAVTDGGGDWTEHGVFGVDFNENIYVLDWWRGQTAADAWIESQCDLIIKHEPITWFGEAGPIRRAVEPFMMKRMTDRKAYCRMEWMPSIADKPTRARSIQAVASMGKLFLPKNAVWKGEILNQLLRFPAGKHDDAVDVFSLMGRSLQMVRGPKKQKKPTEQAYKGGWMAA
jgi:predicted phage terminase large subunit-like protein